MGHISKPILSCVAAVKYFFFVEHTKILSENKDARNTRPKSANDNWDF